MDDITVVCNYDDITYIYESANIPTLIYHDPVVPHIDAGGPLFDDPGNMPWMGG